MARKLRRARRTWPQRLLILMTASVGILSLVAAGALTLVRSKAQDIDTLDLSSASRPQSTDTNGARNILLVGTDNAEGLDKKDPILKGREKGGDLADVIMILRIDPDSNNASLLSIPRDSWVPIAPNWNNSKINSALGRKGAENLIATIKRDFGISIDNYAQVNFAGFLGVMEVLGDIPVYLNHPVKDSTTGLWLTQTGCIKVEPRQALALSRSRHLSYQKGDTYSPSARWVEDGTGDLGRITRQQEFLRRVAQRAIDRGIRNPSTAFRLVDEALKSVKIDKELSIGEIVEIIQQFRSFSVGSLKSNQIPTESAGSKNTISYQKVLWGDAEGMLDVFRGINPDGTVSPRDVIVGLAPADPKTEELSAQLEAIGFDVESKDDSIEPTPNVAATTIRFGIRGVQAARTLARYVNGPVEYLFQRDLTGQVLEVTPGTRFGGIAEEPAALESIPTPTFPAQKSSKSTTTTSTSSSTTVVGATSTTANSVSTSTLPVDVTTTTAPGFQPIDPVKSDECD